MTLSSATIAIVLAYTIVGASVNSNSDEHFFQLASEAASYCTNHILATTQTTQQELEFYHFFRAENDGNGETLCDSNGEATEPKTVAIASRPVFIDGGAQNSVGTLNMVAKVSFDCDDHVETVDCPSLDCASNSECPADMWCRQTKAGCWDTDENQCTPYRKEGETCGEYTIMQYSRTVCDPSLRCKLTDRMIPDLGGTCVEKSDDNLPPLCMQTADCDATHWCRKANENSNSIEHHCVPYMLEGDACGGLTLPSLVNQCYPSLRCNTDDNDPRLPDSPGVCTPTDMFNTTDATDSTTSNTTNITDDTNTIEDIMHTTNATATTEDTANATDASTNTTNITDTNTTSNASTKTTTKLEKYAILISVMTGLAGVGLLVCSIAWLSNHRAMRRVSKPGISDEETSIADSTNHNPRRVVYHIHQFLLRCRGATPATR